MTTVRWRDIWRSKSITRTVLVSMLLVALVPLLIMAVQGYHCASEAVVQLQASNLRSVLEARRTRIDDWLGERQGSLTALASAPCIWGVCSRGDLEQTDTDYREACHLLNHAHARSGGYESLVIFTPDWQRVSASKQSVHSDSRLVPPEFRAILSEASALATTLPHFHEGGMIGIHMGSPVLGDQGNKVGYIVAVLDLSTTVYTMLQDRAGLGETTRTYIVSSDGHYLSQPTKEVHLLAEAAHLPDDLLMGLGSGPFTYTGCTGKAVVGVSTRIPELGWVLVAEIDRTEALAWLASLRRRAMGTGAMTLVLVMGLALRSAHKITLPFKTLAEVSRLVSSGHFEMRVGALHETESQDVANAFNSMLDELSSAHAALVQSASLSAIGELSSSIVHEMRNPLSSVKMNIKALREKVGDDVTYAELGEIASGQVDRLERMLNDLLQYSKPLELHKELLTFDALCADVLVALAGLAERCRVELRVVDHTDRQRFAADREQLRRALTNLADNAIRASLEGGAVVVTGAAEASEGKMQLVVHVDDAGNGISESVRARLFEPFVSGRGDGTGLGLANVRKVVELHGGRVTGENRAGGGARFTVRLPIEGVS
ncbi:MAG: sensor histidine kinase [Lentisphaerae bacterium]|nr:sensor histidine kinase [Lentisphaerota bacterium]